MVIGSHTLGIKTLQLTLVFTYLGKFHGGFV